MLRTLKSKIIFYISISVFTIICGLIACTYIIAHSSYRAQVITISRNNHKLTFVFNIHGGTPEHLDSIQMLIDQASCVVYEDVREKSICKIWDVVEPFALICGSLNLNYMGNYLQYPQKHLVDVTMKEVQEFYNQSDINLLYEQAAFIEDSSNFFRKTLFGIGCFIAMGEKDPLIIERNKILYDYITLHLIEQDCTIVYGLAHKIDIINRFESIGYEVVSTVYWDPFE